jgi:fluoride exporter
VSAATVVAVLVSGAAGALLRHGTVALLAARSRRLPWGVLAVNAAGSLVAGLAMGLAQAGGLDADARLVIVTGFCAGLTTFSTFSVETVQLVLDGRARAAVASVAANVVLGIALAAAGWAAGALLG